MNNRDQIIAALRDAGVRPGDHLVVHSSLRAVGKIDGGADALIDAFLESVGTDGTVIMPAFNYTRPPPTPYFDPLATPGATGAVTELFRQRPGTRRSLHPAHSVCARGERADEFLADHHRHGSFGIGSPLDRVAQAGGWVLLVGVSQTSNSTVHVGESHAGIKKFWWSDAGPHSVKVKIPDIDGGGIIEVPLDCSSSCSMAFNAVEWPLRQRGTLCDLNIGDAMSYLMRGRDVIDAVMSLVRSRPDALFCTRGECRPCRLGRAAVEGER